MPISVHEVTVAAPDILRVELRDGEIDYGQIIETDAGSSWTYDVVGTYEGRSALVIGPNKDHIRTLDIGPDAYLDRTSASNVSNWGISGGGLSVSSVYRKTFPIQTFNTKYSAGNVIANGVRMAHYCYLKLSGNIASGTSYTISFPSSTGLDDYVFLFNDKTTRCSSIYANQLGYRPSDQGRTSYLALWVPGYGTEGVVDFATDYSVSNFYVIDDDGNAFPLEGSVTERRAPDELEDDLYQMQSASMTTTETRRTITNITSANPAVITYTGADPSEDDLIWIDQVTTMYEVNAPFQFGINGYRVKNLDTGAKTFQVQRAPGTTYLDTSSGFTPFGAGTGYWWPASQYGKSYDGTHVFGLDWSSIDFSGFQGTVRIYIPGLGVSDPIRIGDEVWWTYSKAVGGGLFHQRNGIAFNGEFDDTDGNPYAQPAAYDSSVDPIYYSELPVYWASELGGPINTLNGANANWLTATEFTDTVGGHQDAGDWDGYTRHATAVWQLLDAYEQLPTSTKDTAWGVPKSSATIGSTYAAIDGMGDLIHESIWWLDFYRRNQNATGWVIGGTTMSGTANSRISLLDPAYLDRNQRYVYAPSFADTFLYAVVAAKMAKIFNDAGYSALATLYSDSAESAYSWASGMLSSSTTRDAFYLTAKTIADAHETYNYSTLVAAEVTAATKNKAFAAIALYRATEDSAYLTDFNAYTPTSDGDVDLFMRIEAGLSNHVSASTYRAAIVNIADTYYENYIDGASSYKLLKFNALGNTYGVHGGNMEDVGAATMRAYGWASSNNAKYKRWLEEGLSFHLGANQSGMSWVTGLGARDVTEGVLNRTGMATRNFPKGISIYGVTNQVNFQKGNTFEGQYFSYVSRNEEAANVADNKDHHWIEPHYASWPAYEAIWLQPFMIEKMEYTHTENMVRNLGIGLLLWGHDENTQTSQIEEGSPDMLVTTSGNAIVTNGSIERATSIQAGVRITWRGLTLDLPAVTYTVTPVI